MLIQRTFNISRHTHIGRLIAEAVCKEMALTAPNVYIQWNTACHFAQFPKVDLVCCVVCVLQRAGFGRGRGGGGGGGGGGSGGGFGAPPPQ